ncbi:hypothetical protein ILYODFUR_038558, partial [Ilyodon furcidens]
SSPFQHPIPPTDRRGSSAVCSLFEVTSPAIGSPETLQQHTIPLKFRECTGETK